MLAVAEVHDKTLMYFKGNILQVPKAVENLYLRSTRM